VEQILPRGGGTGGREEEEGKSYRRVHVCKWKNEICSNYSGNGRGEGIKKNGGRGEFKYEFVNATMYPHPAQQLKKIINTNTWVYYCRLCHSEAQRISRTERA
jgi:hypothetical protein